jgi:hypothetical protein
LRIIKALIGICITAFIDLDLVTIIAIIICWLGASYRKRPAACIKEAAATANIRYAGVWRTIIASLRITGMKNIALIGRAWLDLALRGAISTVTIGGNDRYSIDRSLGDILCRGILNTLIP